MNLEKTYKRLLQAHKEMGDALRKKWPEGSRVNVILSSRQLRPSLGVVISHKSDGYLCVRLDNAKEWSRRPCRNVHFSDVQDANR